MEMTKLPDTIETVEAFQTCMHAKKSAGAHGSHRARGCRGAAIGSASAAAPSSIWLRRHTMSTPEKVAVFPFAVLSLIDSNGTILDDSIDPGQLLGVVDRRSRTQTHPPRLPNLRHPRIPNRQLIARHRNRSNN